MFHQPLPPDLKKLASQLSLDNMDINKMKFFLSKRPWVTRLVDCIVNVGYCNIKIAYQLHSEST